MKRLIRKFASKLTGANRYLFFIVMVAICVIAISLSIYAQFFYKYSETDPLMLGINIGSQKKSEEIANLKSNFNNMFTNSITIKSENVKAKKIEHSKDLVYTVYELVDEDENYYSINAKIPILNINTDNSKKINARIREKFYDLANNIMRQKETKNVYTVSYAAFVNQEIVSIVIKASLKEGTNAEKVFVETYNYSINQDREVNLDEIIEAKGIKKEDVQKNIDTSIKDAYNNALQLSEEFGQLYTRNLNSDIYKLQNTKNYFLTHDGYVYILYAYGNEDYTNEIDIVIF